MIRYGSLAGGFLTQCQKKLNSVIGIDIGSQTIKVAELRSQGRDPSITALGMIATPEGAVDHTGIFNPDAVAMALKAVLADVPQPACPSRWFRSPGELRCFDPYRRSSPHANPNELREHMSWEINRNIPFAESTGSKRLPCCCPTRTPILRTWTS